MKTGKLIGVILILASLAISYWAYTHSPQAGFKSAVNDLFSGSMRFNKNEFYAIVSACGVLFLYGFYRLLKK